MDRIIHMKDENVDACKNIVTTLEKIINGELFIGNDGEYTENDTDENGDELEQVSLCDYFTDGIYKIQFTVADKYADTVDGVRIMVACGGPNIYIDTNLRKVELFWWNEYACYDFFSDLEKALVEFANELYFC